MCSDMNVISSNTVTTYLLTQFKPQQLKSFLIHKDGKLPPILLKASFSAFPRASYIICVHLNIRIHSHGTMVNMPKPHSSEVRHLCCCYC